MTTYDIWADTHHDNPPSANERVAKLRLELNHLPLAELVEQEVVKWDKNSHVVMEGPKFDEKETDVVNDG
jgi:hypothetical protein